MVSAMPSRSHRRPFRRAFAAVLIMLGVLPVAIDGGLGGSVVDAELIQSFTPPVFNTNTNGAIDIIGNALLTCDTSNSNCAQTLAGTRNSGNGSFSMQRLDADNGVLPAAAANQTTSSSRAALAAPAGSTVLFAGLYWSAQSNNSNRNRLSFLTPGAAAYTTVTGSVANAGSLYQGFADVTAAVQAAGNGDYWAGNIQASTGTNRYAAWSLVVVYQNPALPVRSLSVFDGFGRVTSSFRQLDVPVSGFLTPPFGNVNAEIGVVAYEGDRNISGDQIRVDRSGSGSFVNLSNAANPTTNFGNGSISDNGVIVTTRTPAAVNNLSIDADQFATTNLLSNSQTSTTVRFQTTGDWWYPGVLTFAVDLFVPEFPTITKTVVDLNGGTTVPGDELEYTITFDNVGNDGALNSVMSDPIPANTSFVPNSIRIDGVTQTGTAPTNRGEFAGGSVIARVGQGANGTSGGAIYPGDSVQVKFRVMVLPGARGTSLSNTATLNYTAQTLGQAFSFDTNTVVTPVPPLADLSITKTASPSPAVPGTDETWTLVISNAGPNPATGVKLTDTLPAGLTAGAITGATCTGTTTLTCDVADIAPGTSRTVTVVTALGPAIPDGTLLQNTAQVSLNEDDATPGNNAVTAGVPVRSEADLSVTKSDDVDPVPVGGSITYTVTVTNDGPSTAPDVSVSDSPDGATTATSVTMPGATCTLASRTCVLPSLAPGASAVMTVVVDVKNSASGSVTNSASVQSAVADDDQSNNSVSEPTVVTPIADVTVTKSVTSGPLVAGGEVTYLVRVQNTGPSTAAAVTMTDTLDAGLSLISAASPVGTCSGNPTITCNLGSLNSGASVDIVVTATVSADVTGATVGNTAAVSTATDEGANANANTSTVSDIVVNSADLRITKEVDNNPLLIGGAFVYTITVTNAGPSTTSGTHTMTDVLPDGLTPDTAPGCDIAGQTVTCENAAPIPVDGSVVYTIAGSVPGNGGSDPTVANTATISYPTDPIGLNNSATASTDLDDQVDLRLDKEWTTPSVVAGENATFTLTVTNSGPSQAKKVDVVDAVPYGVIESATLSPSGSGRKCDIVPGGLDCDLKDLDSGDTITITVVVEIDPGTPSGNLSNSATATTDTDDRNPSNNTDIDQIVVSRAADLTITKAVGDPTPNAGGTIGYEVVVTNLGPSTAKASFVGDALPAGLTIVGPSILLNGVPTTACSAPSGVLTCDLGELAVSDTRTITYDVVIDASIDPGTVVANAASATSSTPDPSPATVSETVTVGTSADLKVTKTASVEPATPGGPLTYRVTVENLGPSDARDVVLDDTLPTGYTATLATSPSGSCSTVVSCDLGTIAAGDSAVITIVGSIDAGLAAPDLTNETDGLTSSTPDPDGSNNSGSVTSTLAPSADLSITKAASPTAIEAGGGPVTYTIAVGNAGPSDATDVVVTDSLPAGFVVAAVTPSQGTCTSPTAFPCDLGTVDAGGSPASVTVTGSFPSTAAATVATNTAQVSTTTPDPNTANDEASVDVTVTTAADVSVAKSAPAAADAGAEVTYRITVQNAGPSSAADVTLSDVLDAALLDADNATATTTFPGGTCTNTGGTIDCDLGAVGVGDLVIVNVRVELRSNAPAGSSSLSNTAAIVSATPDPNPDNDSSTATTDVTTSADLGVVKTKLGAAEFVAGEPSSYQIVVTNNGPSDAADVVVEDTPDGLVTLGSVSSSPPGCTALPCAIPTLVAGDSVTITVEATVDDGATGPTVSNTASVLSATTDPNPGNDGSTIDTAVIARRHGAGQQDGLPRPGGRG